MKRHLEHLLSAFHRIPLEALEDVDLLDRFDTKFAFHSAVLADLFPAMISDYHLLAVNRVAFHRYETLYFDTPEMKLFARHHSGIAVRHKIRFRKYLDTGGCFFEIKSRNNKGRTLKKRVQVQNFEARIRGEAEDMVVKQTPLSASELATKLWVSFTRLTFKSQTARERVTIDQDIVYRTETNQLGLPNLAIAEVKRDDLFRASPFIQAMRELRIRPGELSKYCFGVANLYPNIKMNLLKPGIKQIKSMTQ
jgi:hypothetical protein